MATTQTLVPCPLGPKCLTGAQSGHEPNSQALADCTARANRIARGPEVSGFDPSRAYKTATPEMQRMIQRVKRAWGADGRGVPLLVGPPGIGKSEFVMDLARSMGAECMVFDVSSMDPDALNGIPYNPAQVGEVEDGDEVLVPGVDKEGKPTKTSHVRRAGRLYEREIIEMFYRDPEVPLVVFLDEINGGKEALMSSLQKVLTGRILPQEGQPLNDNVLFVAAMNDAEHTSNGTDLAAAMVSRLTPIEFRPNFDEWVNGELSFWGKGFNEQRAQTVAATLGLTPPTAEHVIASAAQVAAFLEERGHPRATQATGDVVNIFCEPLDDNDYSKKVGQPRSWSKVIQSMALAMANMDPDENDTEVFADIIRSNCGARAARDFTEYHATRKDLPDVKAAIKEGTFGDVRKTWKAHGRSDIPMFVLSMLAHQQIDLAEREKIANSVKLVAEIADDYPDMVALRFPSMVRSWLDQASAANPAEGGAIISNILLGEMQGREEILKPMLQGTLASRLVDGSISIDEAAVSAAAHSKA